MKKIASRSICWIGFAVLAAGCHHNTVHQNNKAVGTSNPGAYSYSRIAFGEQGGVTGAYTGFRIDSTGTLYRVRRTPGGKTVEELLGLFKPELLDSLGVQIETSAFFQTDYQKHGNMTYSIEIQKGAILHRVSWPVRDQKTPQSIKNLRQKLMSYAQILMGYTETTTPPLDSLTTIRRNDR